jgi:hypothetical protein
VCLTTGHNKASSQVVVICNTLDLHTLTHMDFLQIQGCNEATTTPTAGTCHTCNNTLKGSSTVLPLPSMANTCMLQDVATHRQPFSCPHFSAALRADRLPLLSQPRSAACHYLQDAPCTNRGLLLQPHTLPTCCQPQPASMLTLPACVHLQTPAHQAAGPAADGSAGRCR